MNTMTNLSEYPPEANTVIANKYHTLNQEIQDMIPNWKKFLKLSDILGKSANILLIVSGISAIIYGIVLHKIWYMVILNIIIAIAGSTLVSGIIFFLFKPILWFLRSLALKNHSKIVEKENELWVLENLLVDQNAPEEAPKVTKEMYLANKNKIKYKTLLRKYKENLLELTKIKGDLRISKLAEQMTREWIWIRAALGVAGLAVSIVLCLIALYLLIVFLCVVVVIAIVIAWITPRDGFYFPPRYDPPDPYAVPKSKEYNLKSFSKKDAEKEGIVIEKLDVLEKRYERLTEEHNDLLNSLILCVPEIKMLYK